jgi:hypothetical protein
MKLQGSALSGLALALQRAFPQQGDTDLSVPPIILNSLEVPEPIIQGFSFGTGIGLGTALLMPSSFLAGYNLQKAVAAGLTTDLIARLDAGVWRIDISWHFEVAVNSNLVQLYYQLLTPSGSGGGQAYIFNRSQPSFGNTQLAGYQTMKVTIPKGTEWRLECDANNAAGTNVCTGGVGLNAQKLVS